MRPTLLPTHCQRNQHSPPVLPSPADDLTDGPQPDGKGAREASTESSHLGYRLGREERRVGLEGQTEYEAPAASPHITFQQILFFCNPARIIRGR